jgi:hypothetical protein
MFVDLFFKTKFKHFKHDVSLITHNHLPQSHLVPSTKTKIKKQIYLVPKFNRKQKKKKLSLR